MCSIIWSISVFIEKPLKAYFWDGERSGEVKSCQRLTADNDVLKCIALKVSINPSVMWQLVQGDRGLNNTVDVWVWDFIKKKYCPERYQKRPHIK